MLSYLALILEAGDIAILQISPESKPPCLEEKVVLPCEMASVTERVAGLPRRIVKLSVLGFVVICKSNPGGKATGQGVKSSVSLSSATRYLWMCTLLFHCGTSPLNRANNKTSHQQLMRTFLWVFV